MVAVVVENGSNLSPASVKDLLPQESQEDPQSPSSSKDDKPDNKRPSLTDRLVPYRRSSSMIDEVSNNDDLDNLTMENLTKDDIDSHKVVDIQSSTSTINRRASLSKKLCISESTRRILDAMSTKQISSAKKSLHQITEKRRSSGLIGGSMGKSAKILIAELGINDVDFDNNSLKSSDADIDGSGSSGRRKVERSSSKRLSHQSSITSIKDLKIGDSMEDRRGSSSSRRSIKDLNIGDSMESRRISDFSIEVEGPTGGDDNHELNCSNMAVMAGSRRLSDFSTDGSHSSYVKKGFNSSEGTCNSSYVAVEDKKSKSKKGDGSRDGTLHNSMPNENRRGSMQMNELVGLAKQDRIGTDELYGGDDALYRQYSKSAPIEFDDDSSTTSTDEEDTTEEEQELQRRIMERRNSRKEAKVLRLANSKEEEEDDKGLINSLSNEVESDIQDRVSGRGFSKSVGAVSLGDDYFGDDDADNKADKEEAPIMSSMLKLMKGDDTEFVPQSVRPRQRRPARRDKSALSKSSTEINQELSKSCSEEMLKPTWKPLSSTMKDPSFKNDDIDIDDDEEDGDALFGGSRKKKKDVPIKVEAEEAEAEVKGIGGFWGKLTSSVFGADGGKHASSTSLAKTVSSTSISKQADKITSEAKLPGLKKEISTATYFRKGKKKAAKAEYLQAVALYNFALVRQREELGPNHIDCGTTLNEIGMCWMMLGERYPALTAFEEALFIRQKHLGDGAMEVAEITNNIWMILHEERNEMENMMKEGNESEFDEEE